MSDVRIERVEPCEHGYLGGHEVAEGSYEAAQAGWYGLCGGGSTRVLDGFPPEAVEAAGLLICANDEHPLNPVPAGFKGPCVAHHLVAVGALAAVWDALLRSDSEQTLRISWEALYGEDS